MKKLINMPERQIKFLKEESERLGLSASELIRRIVDRYIEEKEKCKP